MGVFKLEGETGKAYGEMISTDALIPLILTHVKPACQNNCIDNICTSNVCISHHCSVFQLTDLNYGQMEKVAVMQYYDFSNSKTEQSLDSIDNTHFRLAKIQLGSSNLF